MEDKIFIGSVPIRRILYPAKASPILCRAAEELHGYLKKSLGLSLPFAEGQPCEGAFYISTTQDNPELIDLAGAFEKGKHDQSFAAANGNSLFLTGENPLSALFAVYDFLQECLGIRFFAARHEYVPEKNELRLNGDFIFKSSSDFAIRSWVNRTNDPEVIKFAVQNRINTILGCGPWNPSFGTDKGSIENAEIVRSCGLKMRGPGHCWRYFIPDESLFASHPEYFPLLDGQRCANKRTACFSNPEVMEIFRNNLRNYLRENPYWDIFAFWAEDIHDLYYCGCPECIKKTPSDWYMILVNEAAKVLDEENPEAIFELIAYNATRTPPSQIRELYLNGRKMLVNLCIGQNRDIFRPIQEKTYGSAEVFSRYEEWRKYLSDVKFEGQIMLMEYYNLCEWPNQGPRGRALLWPMEVIREDLRFYLKDGISGCGAFTGVDCLCWPTPFNIWSWLKLWSKPETSMESLKNDFYPKYFGRFSDTARKYIEKLESVMSERTSRENIAELKGLEIMLDSMPVRDSGTPLAERLNLLRLHHQYCVLLKEIFQACSEDDTSKWESLEVLFTNFFETHRALLQAHMSPYPPLWGTLWSWYLRHRKPEMIHNRMLR